MKDYFVIEICRNHDGSARPAVYGYESKSEAESRFYAKCSTAVASEYAVHTVMLVNVGGGVLEHKSFQHAPAVTPEPETATEE